jgi:VWFA-related protein
MRPVIRHAVRFFAAVLVAWSAPFAAAAQETPSNRIKVSVEVIAVDVQVIDRSGQPVPNLGPEKFTVTINGKRRRVVSAEHIGDAAGGDTEGPAASGTAAAIPSRVIMVAVDSISFDATASRDVIQSVTQFVRGLHPEDYVGLSVYPNGAAITPTTDHAAIVRALNSVVGQRDGPGLNRFRLRPSEIIDANRDVHAGAGPALDAVVARECGRDPDPNCRYQLLAEVTNTALYYEGQATASLGMLRTLVTQMQRFPGRKTLLLVSGGMIASDTPGGRPDLGGLGIQVGKEAAIANTAIYTLHIDSSLHDRFGAETRSANRTVDNQLRDSAVLARWLEQFTGAAGGALFTVMVGNADSALARIQRELSSYYLLGVEPGEEERDGRTHAVTVRITEPNVTIRGRRWVMIPKRGAIATAAPITAAPDASAPPAVAAPPRRTAPADVTALADVFDRGSAAAFQRALSEHRDLPNLLRGFRQADSPWPDHRRRTAVFALELAVAGLRSDNRDARDEAGRVLAEYHVRVREPAGADEFECWWLVTEAAALEGTFIPENAMQFIPRALQRCPASGRLRLAHAMVSEQLWLRGRTVPGQESEIVARYEEAMKSPDVQVEARVRAARFLYGLGQFDRSLKLLEGLAVPPADLEMRYCALLIRGQALRASGRLDEAAAAYRSALEAWPGAQSARVALMTLHVSRGNREAAAALADAIQTAPADQYDPWWTYWLGNYRVYPAIVDRLRELAR